MRYSVFFIFILLFILLIRFAVYYKTRPTYKEGQRIELTITLLQEPIQTKNGQKILEDGLTIFLPFSDFHYGDTLKITGFIQESKRTQISTGNKTVIKQNLFVKNPEVRFVKRVESPILSVLHFIRQKTRDTFSFYLNQQESSLLLGIVFGFKETFSNDFKNALKTAGVLHVIAASGMNVSMVGGFLALLFSRLPIRRQIGLIVTVGTLFFYALLSGFEPSIVRATLMGSFAYGALLLGRQNSSYLNLLFTSFIMLLVSPVTLFDLGFELSFLSTLGILSLKPTFDTHFRVLRNIFVFDDFATTLSAQLATLPLVLSVFGSYSPISILVNLLVLWTIPLLMVLGMFASLIAFLAPYISGVFLYLSYPLLFFFEKIVVFFSSFARPLEIQSLPISITIGYYLLLISSVLYLRKRVRKQKQFET